MANQQSSGGWGFTTSGSADADDTSAAIMALSEAGISSSDAAMVRAVNFLKSMEKSNGGIAFSSNFDANGASDAWAISALNKIGVDAKSWLVNAQSPVDHLISLRKNDGSFSWQISQASSAGVTAYAVVALSGKSYPIVGAVTAAPVPQPQQPVYTPPQTSTQITTPSGAPSIAPTSSQTATGTSTPASSGNNSNTSVGSSATYSNSNPYLLPPEKYASDNAGVYQVPSYQIYKVDTNTPAPAPTQPAPQPGPATPPITISQQPSASQPAPAKAPAGRGKSYDADKDGIPDDVEIANGFDPNNPAPCKRSLDSRYSVAYGEKRLSAPSLEKCFAMYLSKQLKGIKQTHPWSQAVNAFIYGGYTAQDIKKWEAGQNTVSTKLPKWKLKK
ncbi:hypothetical protein HY224_02740 [Candidatus Uhrbacteria bacterium]|nr:hypothetical protein [Candidatus Uhrbacteria bacterium]